MIDSSLLGISDPIKGFQGQYRWLSNFWPCIIIYDGVEFKSTEAAYQAAKFPKEWWGTFSKFSGTEAYKAKNLAKIHKDSIVEGFHLYKLNVMEELSYLKYSSKNLILQNKLIATGSRYLEETNSWKDTYWGVCNGIGQNNLGKILMEVRAFFQTIKGNKCKL